jgi:hypothetical protein
MKDGNPLVPDSGQIAAARAKYNCTLEEAKRRAQKDLLMKGASDIDTTSDVRRFLMALVEVLA